MWWVVYYLLLQLGLSELWDEFLAKGCKHHVLFLKPICITRNIAAVSRSPATRVFFRQLWGHSNLAFTRGKYRLASRYQLSTWHRTVSLKFLSSKKKKKKKPQQPTWNTLELSMKKFLCAQGDLCVVNGIPITTTIRSEYPLEGRMLKLKLQYYGHLMQTADSLEKTLMLGKIEGKRRRGWQRIRLLDSIIDSMDMSKGYFHNITLWKQTPRDSERHGNLACCSHGVTESDMTKWTTALGALLDELLAMSCSYPVSFLKTH